MTKWIFVTGGVLSGLGKGLVSASIGKLLEARGRSIAPVKCDGYLNVDPGTMNPHEHGEVFVLEDGTEVDMDFGHYERFLDCQPSGDSNLTSGKVFKSVIDAEREGDFLGDTVQMVPHVTDDIKRRWKDEAERSGADVVAVEVGGTVGDIENMLYLEAVRQMRNELPGKNTMLVHVTLVPFLETTGELKTKPTQHSVKKLRETGLRPDMIVGRSDRRLNDSEVEKISLFCDVPERNVVSNPDLDEIHRLPLVFEEQDVGELACEELQMNSTEPSLGVWRERTSKLEGDAVAKIGIAGKYTEMDDSYASVEEALRHAAAAHGGDVEVVFIDTEDFEPETIEGFDGVVVPGGFGKRGVEGKLAAIKHCRETDTPILGLCYGMQLMAVEAARNQLDLDAGSAEWGSYKHEVVCEMESQKDTDRMGGTMRLGGQTAELSGQVEDIYGNGTVSERHRHRYELDPSYQSHLEGAGLVVSGINPGNQLAEFVERPDHGFFIGTQAHPEFKSSLESPSPLFSAFVEAAADGV